MRKSLVYASIVLVVLALAALVATSPINAETLTACPDGRLPYIVQEGDRLWTKEGPQWALGWPMLKAQNPQIDFESRRKDYTADDIRVNLVLGEPICGLAASGFQIRKDGKLATNLEQTAPPNTATRPPGLNNNLMGVGSSDSLTNQHTPWWLVIAIVALGLLGLLIRWWLRFTHPTTAGVPMQSRRINEFDSDDVVAAAETLGNARYGRLGTAQETNRPRLIGPIESGIINGIGRVGYHGGSSSIRLMRDEPGFRANFRMPDGTTQQLIFLQGCGNDVTFSGLRYTGFTFRPVRVAAMPPTPAGPVVVAPNTTFGIAEARQFDSIQQRTDADRRDYLLLLNHLGVRITLADEVSRQREGLNVAATRYIASARAKRAEMATLRARLVVLQGEAMAAERSAAGRREESEGLQRLQDSFIPPPPAPAAETTKDTPPEPTL